MSAAPPPPAPAAAPPPSAEHAEHVDVRIIGLPLAVYSRAQQHGEELIREFELVALSMEGDPRRREEVPGRLIDLIEELQASYGGAAEDAETRITSAMEAGAETVDVVVRVPRDASTAVQRLDELLDEADAYCAAGTHLMTLAASPESVRFRKWYLGEFVRQLAGERPTTWEDYPG